LRRHHSTLLGIIRKILKIKNNSSCTFSFIA
jgi:hypothetical protein